jgi:hypothetical protein
MRKENVRAIVHKGSKHVKESEELANVASQMSPTAKKIRGNANEDIVWCRRSQQP